MGEGTTFTLRLPADHAGTAVRRGARRTVDAPDARPATRGDVLVIDDDAAQRDLMSRFLERQGFAAHTAADGEAGLELARRAQAARHPARRDDAARWTAGRC